MSGFGAWELAAQMPDTWAAVVPICGGGNPLDAPLLEDIPIKPSTDGWKTYFAGTGTAAGSMISMDPRTDSSLP